MVKVAGIEIKDTQIGDSAKSPLISNIDGSQTPLSKVIGDKVIISQEIDLSASAIVAPMFVADSAYTMVSAGLAYTEGSSSDAGIDLSIGKIGNVTYFAGATTETDTSDGYIQELAISESDVSENDIVVCNSPGSKTGAGKVVAFAVLQKA